MLHLALVNILPGPSKGCLLETFKYLKTTSKHPLEGAGMLLWILKEIQSLSR